MRGVTALATNRLVATAVVLTIVLAVIIGVVFFVRGQLAEREELIVAQAEDTSYEVVPCEPDMLDIALTRTGSIAGLPVTFGLTVTNESEQACSLDAGSDHLVMRVTSGSDEIWSSAHCPSGADSRLYVFGPDVSSQINVEWSGARSNSECSGGLPAPRPGTYVVEGHIDGVEFPDMRESFVLTDSSGAAPAAAADESAGADETADESEAEDEPAEDQTDATHPTEESPPPEVEYVPD